MTKLHERLYIGTSGWSYSDWKKRFYPADVPRKEWLNWYGTQFPTSEINGSFYRTPSEEAVKAWREQTPPGFRFAWKASQFITHWKRLGENSANSIELMVSRLKLLGPKCGPVLFQLPARFEADEARLARFLRMLPKKYKYAFEFRHESWFATTAAAFPRASRSPAKSRQSRPRPNLALPRTQAETYTVSPQDPGAHADVSGERNVHRWSEIATSLEVSGPSRRSRTRVLVHWNGDFAVFTKIRLLSREPRFRKLERCHGRTRWSVPKFCSDRVNAKHANVGVVRTFGPPNFVRLFPDRFSSR